jgi:hypothetical protein
MRTEPPVREGDRVRCTGPLDDGFLGINRELVGVEGTVTWVGQWDSRITRQVGVKWDNGSMLNLLEGDPYIRLEPQAEWEIDGPVVGPCETCGAVGDVECESDCENRDFREAEFDGVLEQEPS